MINIQEGIAAINDRLKAAHNPIRVKLNARGGSLILRVPRPVRHELSLGVPPSKDGLRRIEIEAHKIGGQLAMGTYSRDTYRKAKNEEKTAGQWIESFKSAYLTGLVPGQRKRGSIQESTWYNTWQGTMNKIPANEPLTEEILLAVVLSIDVNSRSRELACQRLQRLADYAAIAVDLSSHAGEYAPEPRNIPTDAEIIEWYKLISNPSWQWIYGVIAAFGLRPHEAFNCSFMDALTVKVHSKTKTGSRITRAIQPEWVGLWNLMQVTVPKVNREHGKLTGRAFERYEVPCQPYDLRHAWAIRASVANGLPVSVSASMMGHSVATHTKVYHRWLTDAANQEIYQKLILNRQL